MKSFLLTRNILTVVLFSLVFTSLAYAQASRTWVSGVGDDANPCSRTAPCKTFAGAISKTAVGGEIDCLDPGGFGAVTITKSITIDCRGTFGSVLVSSGSGIVVNDGTNAAIVAIRGVKVNGLGSASNGISFVAGAQLHVEDVTIFGFTGNGINLNLTGTPTNAHIVSVTNTSIHNCSGNGIFANDASQTLALDVNRSKIFRSGQSGIALQTNAKATISDSEIVFSVNNGVTLTTSSTEGFLENNTISFNSNGVSSSGGAVARASNNNLTKNGTAFSVSGGTINSFQNNKADGNSSNGAVSNIGTGHGTI